jgi:hypothetical protein
MKNFLIKTFLYITLAIIGIQLISFLYIETDFLNGVLRYRGHQTYSAIKKSKSKSTKKILLLGDSVAKSLFPNDEEGEINSLATNQAIGVPGNYFLLKNYLDAGNTIETLVIIYNPYSLKNNLNQKYSYHYFLKPFFNDEYVNYFTVNLLEQIEMIPNKNYLLIPSIRATLWSPNFPQSKNLITDEFGNSNNTKYSYLSPLSIEYLNKIKDLSIKNGFDIKLLPVPTSTNKKINFISFQKETEKTNLIEEFKFYLDNLNYIDPKYFSDGIHLNNQEIKNYYITKIRKLILE